MAFSTKTRQRIIDGYLHATGRNLFVPSEFVDWLADQPEHECYKAFFGKSDAEAAREYRIGLARQLASGLRIVMTEQQSDSNVIQITTREYPAYISPAAGRSSGGGYERFEPDSPEAQDELARQAAAGLRSWLARYRGICERLGHSVEPLEDLIDALSTEHDHGDKQ